MDSGIEFWKIAGEDRIFAQFSPGDRLIFDITDLRPDQYRRVLAQRPEIRGLAKVHGQRPCWDRGCTAAGHEYGLHFHDANGVAREIEALTTTEDEQCLARRLESENDWQAL